MSETPATPMRPPTIKEMHKFSARGRMWFHILRGPIGLAIDRIIIRWTGYSLMTWQFAVSAGVPYHPTLLLETTGAKTGRRRLAGLPYFEIDGSYVVIGSNGGGPKNPGWSLNLKANPECELWIMRRRVRAQGHIAAGDERARLYERISAVNPSLPRYQESASRFGREVPLGVLTPRTA